MTVMGREGRSSVIGLFLLPMQSHRKLPSTRRLEQDPRVVGRLGRCWPSWAWRWIWTG
jgi:hypothetical protein